MTERWSEIQGIWRNNQALYVVAGFLAGILFFPAIELLATNASELLSGFVPEAVGITVTVLLIDRLNRRRDAAREEQMLKAQLIRDAASQSNMIAKHAIHQLKELKWLEGDKSLLAGANLRGADLREADLWKANLDRAILQWATLEKAYLYRTSLRGADLRHANLIGADLRGTDFSGADLTQAHLTDAIMSGTSVNGRYRQAIFDEHTLLPDGKQWTPETDLTQFGVILNYRSPENRQRDSEFGE